MATNCDVGATAWQSVPCPPPGYPTTPLYAEVRDHHGKLLAAAGDRSWEGWPPDMVVRYGNWAVTDWGLQCLAPEYDMPASQLRLDVMASIGRKTWLPSYSEAAAAVAAARAYHGVKQSQFLGG